MLSPWHLLFLLTILCYQSNGLETQLLLSSLKQRRPGSRNALLHSYGHQEPVDNEDGMGEGKKRTRIYTLLATSRDRTEPGSNYFYNDEVASHLHGYVFLVGGLAAHDEVRKAVNLN